MSLHQKTLLLFILISISLQTILTQEAVIARKTEETEPLIKDPSIKCDTCPCDTCPPEPLPPPPPPPALPECPPPPAPSPPPPSPPPSSPPPPKAPACIPCMAQSPPPPRFYYSPNSGDNLYVTEYNYSGGARVEVVLGGVVVVGVALLQLVI